MFFAEHLFSSFILWLPPISRTVTSQTDDVFLPIKGESFTFALRDECRGVVPRLEYHTPTLRRFWSHATIGGSLAHENHGGAIREDSIIRNCQTYQDGLSN